MGCAWSAPAKVIVFGEHWVVHGGLALAAAIGLRARAYGSPSESGLWVFSQLYRIGENLMESCSRFCNLLAGFRLVASSYGRSLWPARIRIESDIPVGAGLGSSAATALAAVAAYACVGGLEPGYDVLWRAAFEAEKVVHGNPSGVDNTVALYGGFILYRRGSGFKRVEFRGMRDTRLLIVDSGVSRSTRIAVERFTVRLERLGRLGRRLLETADGIVEEALAALSRGDSVRLGELMDVAHGLLNAMGVSHPVLEEIVWIARREGALGAKLTGAGMGGTAIVLVDLEHASRVKKALELRGFRVYEVELGVPGLQGPV
ncbi:mevalonate kinase [Hyperthermus butylicus]|uniref:Mevalonate kinase n=1 Tax=Hyperthermus butylicus (strain DSM 5456 / JCM 9403 / PLM1-5) TaxID=415426 RepID=A2BL67_HYPBU|nr:mevalonate kinase [Hyperthermus butylicus]ABM80728.1 Mevalonate kinase [Hyperthermus butylicus DSM 5456]